MEFARFVDSGKLDMELLRIYEDVMGKSEVLLDIFFTEKRKSGIFTYNVKSEANLSYARDSVSNARKFLSTIKAVLEGEAA